MAVTAAQTTDVSQALVDLLSGVPGCRVYWAPLDMVRPPAVVLGQPTLDFADESSGWCAATWSFPVTVITTRANDAEAMRDMSRLLLDIVTALRVEDVPGVFSIEPQTARPVPVSVNGQELPGYLLDIKVRA